MNVVSEKLRKNSGFVGKVIYDEDGTKYVQISKSTAVGIIACVGLTNNDEPKIGWAIISPKEAKEGVNFKEAQELAIKRAEDFTDRPSKSNPHLPSSLNAQVRHFKERCRAYYNPKFSRRNEKRPGKILKVYVEDSDKMCDSDLAKNISNV